MVTNSKVSCTWEFFFTFPCFSFSSDWFKSNPSFFSISILAKCFPKKNQVSLNYSLDKKPIQCHHWFPHQMTSENRGGSRGRVLGVHTTPSPTSPWDDLRLSNTTGYLPKKKLVFVVYWCWSKTRDRVEEFMLNTIRMVVKKNGSFLVVHSF